MRIWGLMILLFKVNLSRTQLTSEAQCGSWAEWTSRSTFVCEAVCEQGLSKRQRSRDCLQSDVTPDSNCVFAQVEEDSKICTSNTSCPAWSSWSSWSEDGSCSALCGSGIQTFRRTRECVGEGDCTGPAAQRSRRRCYQDRSLCRTYGCSRRTYKAIPQVVTEAGQYALCRYGSISTYTCPRQRILRLAISRLRWQLFFRSRRYIWNQIQLLQDIQEACA